MVPPIIFLEVLNVAGRRWRWDPDALRDLAMALGDIGFDVREPELTSVAARVARGLTAYDAAYVALADEIGSELVSDDAEILSVANEMAQHAPMSVGYTDVESKPIDIASTWPPDLPRRRSASRHPTGPC